MKKSNSEVQLFVVNNDPLAVWDYDDNANRMFLSSYKPLYFATISNTLTSALDDEDKDEDEDEDVSEELGKQIVATHLRLLYAQALETLLALTFATLQAPNCVEGWLLHYDQQDLYDLNERVVTGKGFLSRFSLTEYSWTSITRLIYHIYPEISLNTTAGWYSHFSRDFANRNRQEEYNSIKHGLRASSSSSLLRIVPLGNESLAQSFPNSYGIAFRKPEAVKQGNKINIIINTQRINWSLAHMTQSLNIISLLLYNNIEYLKLWLGLKKSIKYYHLPEDHTVESLLDRVNAGFTISSTTMRQTIDVSSQDLVTPQKVFDSYTKRRRKK